MVRLWHEADVVNRGLDVSKRSESRPKRDLTITSAKCQYRTMSRSVRPRALTASGRGTRDILGVCLPSNLTIPDKLSQSQCGGASFSDQGHSVHEPWISRLRGTTFRTEILVRGIRSTSSNC